jgi:acyl-CoA dehydrogenase
MHLFGLVVLGYMWAKIAKTAEEKLAAGETANADYLRSKLVTAKFFMERIMLETALRKARIETGADTLMALDAAAF